MTGELMHTASEEKNGTVCPSYHYYRLKSEVSIMLHCQLCNSSNIGLAPKSEAIILVITGIFELVHLQIVQGCGTLHTKYQLSRLHCQMIIKCGLPLAKLAKQRYLVE